jgi:hypothetical protein
MGKRAEILAFAGGVAISSRKGEEALLKSSNHSCKGEYIGGGKNQVKKFRFFEEMPDLERL